MRPPRAADGLDQWMGRSASDAPEQGERGARGSVDAFVQRMSNGDIDWDGIRVASGPQRGELRGVFVFPGGHAGELWPPHSHRAADLIPALLIALEQPDKFAVAHALLNMNLAAPRNGPGPKIGQRSAGSVRYVWDGLTFEIRAVGEGSRDATHLGDEEEIVDAVSSVDVAQLPAIRDLWHRRLDVPVFTAPHWLIVSVLLAAPVGLVAPRVYRRLRGRAFARAGRCPNCGYDVRATPGRCPECGGAAAAGISTAAGDPA